MEASESNVTNQEHFCTCEITKCLRHPDNHDEGCDPCMEHNLKLGRIPLCMFKAVEGDMSEAKDLSLKGFVNYYLKYHDVN